MPKNWKTYKLEELLTVLTDYHANGAYKKLKANVTLLEKDDYAVMIRTTNFERNNFEDLIYVDEHAYNFLSKSKVYPGDILMNKIANAGSIYQMPNLNRPVTLAMNLFLLRFNEKVNQYYLFYHLKAKEQYIKSFSAGSVTKTITKNAVRNLKFKLPPLPEQKAIANILSAIDDKIENNLAINKTLEDMAMTLYKHWFVDFGPFQDGEFIDSELGPIPKGWEVKRLDEFCTLTMGQSPKSEFYNHESNGLPFHQGVKDYGERFPNDETYSTEGKRLAEEGDVLFSVRAPVGRLNIAKNKIILGRGLASIRMNDFNHFGFLFYALNTRFTEDDIIGDGTVYKSVNKSELQNLQFLIPTKSIIQDFNQLVKPNDEKYLNNFKENQSLTQLRDTLLPKLISGEVRLKEFQTQIETVIASEERTKQSHDV